MARRIPSTRMRTCTPPLSRATREPRRSRSRGTEKGGARTSGRPLACLPCGWAYMAAFTMAAKLSALSEAPPTRAPSTSSFSRKPATLPGLAEPP